MESRYRGDPINEPMFEPPEVMEVLPEDVAMDAAAGGPEEIEDAEDKLPSLDATWSVLKSEPGMDNMMELAGDYFDADA